MIWEMGICLDLVYEEDGMECLVDVRCQVGGSPVWDTQCLQSSSLPGMVVHHRHAAGPALASPRHKLSIEPSVSPKALPVLAKPSSVSHPDT